MLHFTLIKTRIRLMLIVCALLLTAGASVFAIHSSHAGGLGQTRVGRLIEQIAPQSVKPKRAPVSAASASGASLTPAAMFTTPVVADNNSGVVLLAPTGTRSIPITVPANNNVLLVAALKARAEVLSITYNGSNLTELGSTFNPGDDSPQVGTFPYTARIYYLKLGTVSAPISSNLVVTLNTTSADAPFSLIAESYHNVDQTTPMDGFTSALFGSTSTSSSLTVPGISGDLAFDAMHSYVCNGSQIFVGSGQTVIQNVAANNGAGLEIRAAASREANTGAPVTMDWTISPNPTVCNGAHQAANIRAANSQPEMDMQGNATSIADGDLTPSTADHTDFGSADITSGSVDRVFTIANIGDADLNLTGSPRVQISGANASDFSATVQPTSPVAANGNTTFTVRFDPSAAILVQPVNA
jgi:hypothetical protein